MEEKLITLEMLKVADKLPAGLSLSLVRTKDWIQVMVSTALGQPIYYYKINPEILTNAEPGAVKGLIDEQSVIMAERVAQWVKAQK